MTSERWNDLLAALSDPYRRELLVALLQHNPQDDDDVDPLDLLGAEEDPDVLETALVHKHLPKLREMDIVEWDRESGEISTGPNWDEIAPLLELIESHRDELPEGWL